MSDRVIYLDNNATTQIAPEVLEAMMPWLKDQFYNPSSSYAQARAPRDAVERARETVARVLGAGAKTEILFTGGATEGNNAAIWGVLRANPERRHVITTEVEHPAVLEVCKEVQRYGYRATFLPVDHHGRLDPADLVRAIEPDTAIVSVMHANNETGVVFPIEELSKIVKRTDSRIVFHTDATQSVGKLPVHLTHRMPNVDLLTLSGHKLHAPKGVGAMFVRRGTRWRPFQIGGHQERGRRAGTENVAGIVALGRACELALSTAADELRLRGLQRKLETAIKAQIPNVFINGEGTDRLPNTTNVAFEFIEGEAILYALNELGFCASSGSACTSGSLDPSHVLRAMGLPFTAAHGSLRISTSRFNTVADIDALIEALPPLIASLRRISPYWDSEKDAPREGADVFVQGKYRE